MKYFEDDCKNTNIELYALHPISPKFNGGVERANRIFREECYARAIPGESISAFKIVLLALQMMGQMKELCLTLSSKLFIRKELFT
jgi:hypothetical protein